MKKEEITTFEFTPDSKGLDNMSNAFGMDKTLDIIKTVGEAYSKAASTPKASTSKTYIMKDTATGLYKIGRSINPSIREKTLQSEKPTIELIWIIDKDVEFNLHKIFAAQRVRGEWFSLTDEDIEAIKSKFFTM